MNLLKLTSIINFTIFIIFMFTILISSNITNSIVAYWLLAAFFITTFINGIVAIFFNHISIPKWVK